MDAGRRWVQVSEGGERGIDAKTKERGSCRVLTQHQ